MSERILAHFHDTVGGVDAAVILGSGLGEAAAALTGAVTLRLDDIPGFPRSTVPGHRGVVVHGRAGDRRVLAFLGRRHAYEGACWDDVVLPARIAHRLGARWFFVTNAAGGLRPGLTVGDLMLITALLITPFSPSRFLHCGMPVADGPPHALLDRSVPFLRTCARDASILLREGTYAFICGPSYETRAEIRALRRMGADAVGMSSAPEMIEAYRLGMLVGAVSCVTNIARETPQQVGHSEVTNAAAAAAPRLGRLLIAAARRLPPANRPCLPH